MATKADTPAVERLERARQAFAGAVSEDDLRGLAQQLVRQAKAGDLQAARLLLAYCLPTPQLASQNERPTLTVKTAHRNGAPVN